jgi:hypothetical protein
MAEPTREQVERVAACCQEAFDRKSPTWSNQGEAAALLRALLDRAEELSASLRKCQDALVEKADRAETAERERDGARGAAETYRNDAQHREDAEAFNWGEAPRRLPPLPWEPAP